MNEKKKLRRLPKRIVSFVLSLAMALTLMPWMSMDVKAEDCTCECGNHTYSIDGDTITINGSGPIEESCGFCKSSSVPQSKNVIIGDDITEVGNYAFEMCKIKSITFGSSVETIGSDICNANEKLIVTFTSVVNNIADWAFVGCNEGTLNLPADWPETDLPDEDGNWHYGKFPSYTPPTKYKIILQNNGNGYADSRPENEAVEGADVTITANAYPDYVFDKWESSDITIPDTAGREYTFTMPAKNVTVKAVFKAAHTHDWQYSAIGNKLEAYCANAGCPSGTSETDKVSLTLSASNANYSGSPVEIGVTGSLDGTGLDKVITYYKDSALSEMTTTDDGAAENGKAPSKLGTYYAKLQFKNGETLSTAFAKKEFTISINTWAGLQAAITNAANGSTIKLTTDIVATEGDSYIDIAAEKTVTIDLNGYKLDRGLANSEPVNNGCVLNINGNLTIIDSSNEKSGVITGGNNNNSTGYCCAGGISIISGTLILKGGTISNNKAKSYGGGIITNYGTLKIGGTARVINNTAKENSSSYTTSNIHFNNNDTSKFSILTGDDALVASGDHKAQIGLRFWNPSGEKEVATIANEAVASCFVADNSGYGVYVKDVEGDKKLVVGPHIHAWNYKNDGATLKAWCTAGGCGSGHTTEASAVTLTLTATSPNYSGSAYTGASLDKTAWEAVGLTAPTIKYVGTGDTTYTESTTAPNAVGTYEAKITVGTATAVKAFSITDKVAPTASIKIDSNTWSSFLNTITFGTFFKETKNVTITASDSGSGVKKIEYYVSSKALTETEVKALTSWTAYSNPFSISDDGNYVIYAKVTDKSGNITYVSSNGVVIDSTAPVITGIEDEKTYCEKAEFTVADSNIDTVKVDGTAVTPTDGTYSITGDDADHTVVATDKSGNSTTCTITVKKKHTGGTATCQKKAVCEVCKKEYGALGSHNYAETFTEDKAATCTEKGSKSKHCTVEGCNAKSEVTDIDPLGHAKGTKHNQVDATCTEKGTKEYYECSRTGCSVKLDDDANVVTDEALVINAKGHTGGTATCQKKAVCEVCKKEYGELAGHTVVDDEAVAATCAKTGLTAGKHCSVCKEVLVEQKTTDKLEHKWPAEWTIVKEATTKEEGKRSMTCENGCGTVRSEVIEKLAEEGSNPPAEDPNAGKIEKDVEVAKDAPVEEVTLHNTKSEIVNATGVFTEEEKSAIAAGEDARVWLEIDALDESTIKVEDKAEIEKQIENVKKEAVEAATDIASGEEAKVDLNVTYFDATLFKKVGNEEKQKITDPGTKIEVGIKVPENLLNKDATKHRIYKILRLHNGVAEILDVIFDKKTGELTFKTDKFSTYAILTVDSDYVPVKGVSITSDKDILTKVGETITLTPVVAPVNASEKTVVWTSSDEKIATVDANGKVTAVGEGTVTITATTTDGEKVVKSKYFSTFFGNLFPALFGSQKPALS